MHEQILVRLSPTELQQEIQIYSNNSEIIPIILKHPQKELLSAIAMSAAKYEIFDIKLYGAKDYTLGIKNQLIEKINTCFGKENNFTIELI